ncbi:hypothetical protein [uncultured Shewanella sp.]|uniref:hypothetical protein n=1 Tax=uncultured Shewanella sp. TaxID=173975 RepID=UPI0026167965|nr:hypothetical protein [uncultured Shewanella sp.]
MVVIAFAVLGCEPNDSDYNNKVAEFIATDIGTDIKSGKFVPPYESYEPLKEYTNWCNSVLWPQLSEYQISIDKTFTREEILYSASSEVIGRIGIFNAFIDKSGGAEALYPYVDGNAAYMMKPSKLAIPVIKELGRNLSRSPSFKKSIELAKEEPKQSDSFYLAHNLCLTADLVTGMLGGESRSKLIFEEVATLVQKNTLHSIR